MSVDALVLEVAAPEEEGIDRIRQLAIDPPGPLLLGGFSLGARLALAAAGSLQPLGLLLFGFPFHRRGAPEQRHGLNALADLTAPALIVQGTRDNHGTRSEVRSYGALPPPVQVHWVEDGNHRFVPRALSGLDPARQLEEAASAAVAFAQTLEAEAPHG